MIEKQQRGDRFDRETAKGEGIDVIEKQQRGDRCDRETAKGGQM